MTLLQKVRCPYCGNFCISQIRVFISDLIWRKIECPVCTNISIHPNWVNKLILTIAIGAFPFAYGVGLRHHSNRYMVLTLFVEVVLCLIISTTTSLRQQNNGLDASVHGWRRVVLWLIWLAFILSIIFVMLVISVNVQFISDSVGLLWGLLTYFGITLWITWENFIRECARVFQRGK